MFTWKRCSIALFILSMAMLAVHLSNTPEVWAQIKPAIVRSVDEPSRVPYQITAPPTCNFGNDCSIAGTVVPTGKRLRITRLEGALINQSTNMFFALHLNDARHPLAMFPANQFQGFFWGNVVSFAQEVDYYFEAGQTPVLEVGCSAVATVASDPRNTLSLVGYITDTTP